MIPEKFIQTARAEYFCNVTEFIGLGEGKDLTHRQICAIKMQYSEVEDWFEHLDTIGQLRVVRYLREEDYK